VEDEELVVRIKAGDEDAARELVERYYGAILRYCRWHCQGAERAEDLTQETFFKLFRNLPEYEERKKFRPYLYTIASRLCVDESRRVRLYSLEDEEGLGEESREIRQVENREELSHLLEKLPPELKEVIFLRFGGELSYLEIARITGSNMRTVQSRIRKALKIMRQER
jgi:RNA polymerase sigma-70 factor (ECF subfamily)